VGEEIKERSGYETQTTQANSDFFAAVREGGLTEDEAVQMALLNNSAFRELLTEIGISRGDLIQAGLLPNPEAVFSFEMPDKAYKYAFEFPIEALWLRPIRIAAAENEAARVRERLTQAGLDLIRDVRQGYAEVTSARGKRRIAEEAAKIRSRIATMAESRLQAGDISMQEAAAAKIESLKVQQDSARLEQDVLLAEERLRNLLGIGDDRSPLQLDESPMPSRPELDVDQLVKAATNSRPDANAAQKAAEAAAERLRLTKTNWFRIVAIADATSGQSTGHELSPAVRFTLPIFNWNQGSILRAEAELERAQRQQQTIRNQIIYEVRQSLLRYMQAKLELEILDQRVRPEVEAGIQRTEQAYREGDTTYLLVLESTRQLLDSRLREQQLHLEIHRAWTDLERNVGHRLDGSYATDKKEPAP
jgi:cobalt-zinc-cadmium efflux system outer membrane protein